MKRTNVHKSNYWAININRKLCQVLAELAAIKTMLSLLHAISDDEASHIKETAEKIRDFSDAELRRVQSLYGE